MTACAALIRPRRWRERLDRATGGEPAKPSDDSQGRPPPGLIARFKRDDRTKFLQAARQRLFDRDGLRFVAPDDIRRVQFLDLFDDSTHHTQTRLFTVGRQISRVNLRNRKNPAACRLPALRSRSQRVIESGRGRGRRVGRSRFGRDRFGDRRRHPALTAGRPRRRCSDMRPDAGDRRGRFARRFGDGRGRRRRQIQYFG
jgi:hypothetical protein